MAGQPQGRRRRRAEREPEILAAARQVMESNGLSGFVVSDVAVRAGVSEATVFNYFPARHDLIFRVISDWMMPVVERLEADMPRIEGARARLAFFAARHLIETASAPGMHKLIYRELHWENYYGSTLHRLNQRYARLVTWIVDEGRRDGEVAENVDPALFRDSVFGALHHIGWRTLMNGRPLDIDLTADRIADQLFAGIAASAPRSRGELDAVVGRLESIVDRLSPKGRG